MGLYHELRLCKKARCEITLSIASHIDSSSQFSTGQLGFACARTNLRTGGFVKSWPWMLTMPMDPVSLRDGTFPSNLCHPHLPFSGYLRVMSMSGARLEISYVCHHISFPKQTSDTKTGITSQEQTHPQRRKWPQGEVLSLGLEKALCCLASLARWKKAAFARLWLYVSDGETMCRERQS